MVHPARKHRIHDLNSWHDAWVPPLSFDPLHPLLRENAVPDSHVAATCQLVRAGWENVDTCLPSCHSLTTILGRWKTWGPSIILNEWTLNKTTFTTLFLGTVWAGLCFKLPRTGSSESDRFGFMHWVWARAVWHPNAKFLWCRV